MAFFDFFRRAKPASRALSPGLRLACIGLLAVSTVPLLLSLPPIALLILLAVPGSAAWLGFQRRLHWGVRGALMVFTMLCLILVQSGGSDFRGMVLSLLAAAILMKGSEVSTARDGYSVVGFALLSPFVCYVMEIGGLFNVIISLVSLGGALILASLMAEWQDHLALRPLRSHLASLGIVALASLPLAAASFWILPRLDAPLWGLPGGPSSRTGIDNRMEPGSISNLMQDPSTAFRVDFQTPLPPPDTLYWRGLTLGLYDGRSWTEATTNEPLPFPSTTQRETLAAAQPERVARYSISMEPTEQSYLFVLDTFLGPVPDKAEGFFDGRLMTRAPLRRFSRWEGLTSWVGSLPSQTTLTPADKRLLTLLPQGFNPRALALAEQWRAQGKEDEAVIQAALDWFAEEFTYSLEPPLLGRNAMDEFLFETQVGYCEHYSSAFAVLMRAAGIPTRVVVGYQGGIYNEFGDYWQVRQADAHAWNEVWLDGQGWVRIDPTAALRTQRPPAAGQTRSRLGALGANGPFLDWARNQWATWFSDFDAEKQRGLFRRLGLDGLSPQLTTAIVGGLAVALFLAVAALVMRERRPKQAPELRAWLRLVRQMKRHGHAPLRHEPPQQLAERVARTLPPEQAARLREAAQAFCQWRYADVPSPHLAKQLQQVSVRPDRAR